MSPRKRGTCPNGHDFRVLGRVGQRCRGCVVDERLGLRPLPGLPIEPLAEFLTGEQLRADGSRLDVLIGETLARYYYRDRRRGYITVSVADRICCARGIHPYGVYGEAWLAEAS